MVHQLMPVGTEAPRCSEFARSIGVLPPGSGLFLERAVLVSVPLPWPKPALKHELLTEAARIMPGAAVPSRLFACEPWTPDGDGFVIEVYERRGPSSVHYRWSTASPSTLVELVAAINSLGRDQLDQVRVAEATTMLSNEEPPPTFLICTQGSHDTCCGTTGVALADEIERCRPDYEVRRVSHTGGHRFSPTMLALPEGRMWAFVDLGLVDRIAAGAATTDDHRRRSRGWWGAKVGPAQVAEGAVRAERWNQPFEAPLITTSLDEHPSSYRVDVDGESWLVEVAVARDVPTIACESPGGLPVKPGREFSWTISRPEHAVRTSDE